MPLNPCCIAAIGRMEKELTSDATLEASLKSFGWGKSRLSIITLRNVMKEAARLAKEKMC